MEIVRYEILPVPDALTEPSPLPDLTYLEATEDLEAALAEALGSIQRCNEDKARIRSGATP